MQVRIGLIVGAVGLVLNSCAGAVLGICGPLTALAIGAIAGFLAVREGKPLTREEGMQSGAIAGLIAGMLTAVGQVIGSLLAVLVLTRFSDIPLPAGAMPSVPNMPDSTTQAIYWIGSLSGGLCCGSVDIALCPLAGALTGYFGTREPAVNAPKI